MEIVNTKFQKRYEKLWTFMYTNGEKAQLDFIMINKKWQNSARNCEAYNTFYSVGSDHRIMTALRNLRNNFLGKVKTLSHTEKLSRKKQENYTSKTTKCNKLSLNKALDNLKTTYDLKKKEYLENKLSEIEDAHIQKKPKIAWVTLKEISNSKKSYAGRPSGRNPAEKINLWLNHFKNLLGQPASLPDNSEEIEPIILETLSIPTQWFTKKELLAAIKSTKAGKATGLDNVPAEIWKSGILTDELLEVCIKVFSTGNCPNIWRKAAIIPIPKKGDLTNRQNYRGISLIPIALKIYKMLHNRLKPHLEKILRVNQNGFREGRSTIGQILALLIKAAYTNTTAQVVTEDGNTDFFNIEAGVLQGDADIQQYTLQTDYADDIALLSDSITDAQNLLDLVVNAAKIVGLNINEETTEYLSYNILDKPQANIKKIKYLGSWVDSSEKDIKIRKAQAWSATLKMNNIWKSDLPRSLKINFFRATVESIRLYGSETWTLTKSLNDELDGTYTRLLRHILNISWREHITNEELYKELPKLSENIRTRRLKFAGHCFRACLLGRSWWKDRVRPTGRSVTTTIERIGAAES
ncbi:uncharacterized protein LOC125037418 [Penaeus chinensis]|uniref:uncharacterized protein LOC125037418 n=1 Tax=Penaeus chinensis TaxID=139456 RepID=UPI001FB68842|nr:uncharacterized protein LOC125037418 [Penaeus chinensis]